MAESQQSDKQYVPLRRRQTDFPVIDNDPHLFRAVRYFRTEDYVLAAALTGASPLALTAMERYAPSYASRGTFSPVLRMAWAVGAGAGFFAAYSRSVQRFQGIRENEREVKMDMREMVDKVKRGEPLYGVSTIPEHQQHMAARNSRFSNFFIGIVPWFNLVNHNHHGVETAKYYQQAERELEAEKNRQ